MKKILVLSVFASILLTMGCVTTDKQQSSKKYYTNPEYSKMTYCIGISDTAMYAATAKLKGIEKKELHNYFSSKPNAQLQTATINKVYKAKFTNAWDYTVIFFDECALNLAGVTKQRVNFASYCLQNTLIANAAFINKKNGLPKQHSYDQFSIFKSKTPAKIIDRVYLNNKSRSEVKLDEWNLCMQPISS